MSGHGLADLWNGLADELGDLPSVSCGERVRTWREIDERASRFAGHLLSAGLVPGDRVAVGLRNSVEHIEVLFALFKAGLAPVNLNVRYRAAELHHLLVDSAARGIVVGSSVIPVAVEAAEGTPATVARVAVPDGDPEKAAVAGFTGYESALAAATPLPRERRSADDQMILYTGGTTGKPKGALWRQGEIMGIAAGEYRRRGYEPPETLADALRIAAEVGRSGTRPTVIPASPLMHGTGLFAALGGLAIGGAVALLPGASFSARELWETVVRYRVTDIVISGDVFSALMLKELDLAAEHGTPYDLSSLRVIRSAGMRWSAGNKRALLAHADVQLVDVIASTEGGPYGVVTTIRGDDPRTSRFLLAPGARVINEDGRDVVPGSGEVGLLAAPGRMPIGYLGDPVTSAHTFRVLDGVRYAVPGDRALLDHDGTLTLLGRASSVINSGGEKIHAEEVEEVLILHPAVADAVVVGVPHPRWGQTPNAVVVLKEGAAVSEEDLIEHVRAHLAGYKKPSRVLFAAEIVRTPAGKADRRWAGQYASGAGQDDPATGADATAGQPAQRLPVPDTSPAGRQAPRD